MRTARQVDLGLPLQAGAAPLYAQIADGLVADIRRGRLAPGSMLPGTRALASELGVHRNTVVAAFEALLAEGWLEARAGSGTRVARALPEAAAGEASAANGVGFELPPSPSAYTPEPQGPGILVMGSGTPDVRLIPVDALARAFRRALRRHGGQALHYGDPAGHPRLRAALATLLAEKRALAVGPEGVLVTPGSQMALALAARAILRPGDVVAVEALGYRPAWTAFELAGARLVPVPVDGDGLDPAALMAMPEPPRAVYLTPHHQYPTTVTLSAARRLALLAWARERGVALIEDDYDHEFHYEGRPVMPLASADRAGVVVYVGSLSKVLAPGLRVGFVAGPRPLIERLADWRLYLDRQGNQAVEAAIAELLEDGELQRHVRRVRRLYRERRDALAEAVAARFPDAAYDLPAGGMSLWVRFPGTDTAAWAQRALAHGVAVAAGARFAMAQGGEATDAMRLGFAALTPVELAEAVKRLGAGR